MRTRSRILCLVLLGLATPGQAASLRDTLARASEPVGISSGGAFDALADVIADTAARSLPVISASAGFTYRYNSQLGVFERSAETLGPIYLERAETLGRSKFNVNVSWQYVQFDEYDGDDLDRLESQYPIVLRESSGGTVTGLSATRLQYRLGLRNNVVGLSATYGVLDDLDVNVYLPLISTAMDVGVYAREVATAPAGGGFTPTRGPLRIARTDGNAFGVGDLALRLKYRLRDLAGIHSALGFQLRLPTGDEDDFRGTGDVELSPAFYASTLLWDRVAPHFNLITDIDASDVDRSQVRYGLGVDVDVVPRVGVNLAFLGRSQFSDSASKSETSFLHLGPSGLEQRPLLDLDFGRKDFLDLSFGMRVVVWRQIMLFANGIYALNDSGLRNGTVIPTVGVEGTF